MLNRSNKKRQSKSFHRTRLQFAGEFFVLQLNKYFEDGDWVSAFCTVTAKSKTDGRPVKITGSFFVRSEDGKILEGYNQFDFMSLWGQLELLPIDSFEQGLQEKKII